MGRRGLAARSRHLVHSMGDLTAGLGSTSILQASHRLWAAVTDWGGPESGPKVPLWPIGVQRF